MTRRIGWLAALLALALGLAGCWSRESAVERGIREQVLHRGIGVEIPELDPHLATGTSEYHVLSALFEGLVAEDPRDLRPVPGQAERWEVSADGLTWTFHLRAGLQWSDGTPLVAADFVHSWQRMLSPALGADYAYLLYVIQNAEAWHKGRLDDFRQVGVSAPDERTLRVVLEHPKPHFLSLLQNPAFLPVPLHVITRSGAADQRGNPWTEPGRLVGNGPFTLVERRPGQRIIVKRNPGYWDSAAVRLRAIHFHAIESLDAEERAFRAGQLHVTEALPVSKIDAYRRREAPELRIDPYLGTYFYRVNTARPFLNEPKVRRALAMAIDREAIVGRILRGGQEPASSFVPSGLGDYVPPVGVRTDFAEARRLLAEAGYPGGQGLPPLELLFNTSENHRLIAEAVQEMWRRELGIEVRLLNQEFRVTLAARRTGDYQILRSVWIADYLDPLTFLGIFTSDSGNNHTGWANRDYDRLLYAAQRTADPATRLGLLRQAEEVLLAEMPILPVYHYTHVFLLHPAVRGWYPNVLDRHPYKHVWLEP